METHNGINLTKEPKTVLWPETHYVYIEKFGPIMEIAQNAWQEITQLLPSLLSQGCNIAGAMSLYKSNDDKSAYRAGFSLTSQPPQLPPGLKYERLKGGSYACFVLTGPYSNLPAACGMVFEIVDKMKMKRRDDFFIEHYANDPKTTPPEQLITEILIPIP
ncbi:MAG TPA: GyrI-like domain-containing protein [Verrucomicrobiae bacterium]